MYAFLIWHSCHGTEPTNELENRYIDWRFVSVPNSTGKVPPNLLFCNSMYFKFEPALANVFGNVPVSWLLLRTSLDS